MREVFADSGYWIGLRSRNDQVRDQTRRLNRTLGECRIVTSEMVLVEFLNFYARLGEHARSIASETVEALRRDENVVIIEQSGELFSRAFNLFASRSDQTWSLVDCASFVLMEERGIRDALAHDIDFVQAGFNALLRSD